MTVCLVLRQAQADWLEAQVVSTGDSKSEIVRTLLDRAMKARRR